MPTNFWRNRRGTALLVAMLVMGVLMTVSLALSSLILRESRLTKGLVDSGRAYYAAEAGVEMALYELHNNLPGWGTDDFVPYSVDSEAQSVGEYSVDNRCKAYPCFDSGYDRAGVDLAQYYDVLELNESVTIPLFTVGEDALPVPVKNFTVEFFAPFDPSTDLNVNLGSERLSGWDVLRWKIFGLNEENRTDTISDFTALSMLNSGGESYTTNAARPSWFGSKQCNELSDRYSEAIDCVEYGDPAGVQELSGEQFGQVASLFVGSCRSTQAREYYEYTNFGDERDLSSVHGCYEIGDFLKLHKLNYLSLTNLINPSVFKQSFNKDLQKLYFRVELDGETEREYADVVARGYSGNSLRTVSVQIKKGEQMAVFNFSLYSTGE